MKSFKTISAVALALFVLVSSTSFVIGMHVCMGEVQKVAFFTKADKCKKHQEVPPCHRKAETPCCTDETVIHDGDDLEASLKKVAVAPFLSLEEAQPLVLIAEIAPSASLLKTNFYHYRPPLRSFDLIVEHRVFLI
jgi:hypothetical protein